MEKINKDNSLKMRINSLNKPKAVLRELKFHHFMYLRASNIGMFFSIEDSLYKNYS